MGLIYPIDTIKTRLQLEQPAIPVGVHGWALVQALYAGLPLGLLETGSVHGTSFLVRDDLTSRCSSTLQLAFCPRVFIH